MATASRPRSDVHRRITDAVRNDKRTPSMWARQLGMMPATLNHRLSGRTPWTLDEALEIAFRLGTTVDALRDGSYLAAKQREDRARERADLLRRLEKDRDARRGPRPTER